MHNVPSKLPHSPLFNLYCPALPQHHVSLPHHQANHSRDQITPPNATLATLFPPCTSLMVPGLPCTYTFSSLTISLAPCFPVTFSTPTLTFPHRKITKLDAPLKPPSKVLPQRSHSLTYVSMCWVLEDTMLPLCWWEWVHNSFALSLSFRYKSGVGSLSIECLSNVWISIQMLVGPTCANFSFYFP